MKSNYCKFESLIWNQTGTQRETRHLTFSTTKEKHFIMQEFIVFQVQLLTLSFLTLPVGDVVAQRSSHITLLTEATKPHIRFTTYQTTAYLTSIQRALIVRLP